MPRTEYEYFDRSAMFRRGCDCDTCVEIPNYIGIPILVLFASMWLWAWVVDPVLRAQNRACHNACYDRDLGVAADSSIWECKCNG